MKLIEPEPVYLDKRGAAATIALGISTIDQKRREGELPFYRCGKKILFKKSDLLVFMEKNRVEVES